MGLTLVEIVTSMTVLFIGIFFTFNMFHQAIYYSASVGDEVIASLIAHRKMEEIRGWACELHSGRYNFNAGNWEIWNNVVAPDTVYPKFQICINSKLHPLNSPSTTLAPNRALKYSTRIVKVEILWTSGAVRKNLKVISLIGEPLRQIASLDYNVTGSTRLAPYEFNDLEVQGFDAGGEEIEDLTFHWNIAPITANGTVSYSGTGRNSRFTNSVTKFDGTTTTTVGTCNVYAITNTMSSALDSVSMQLYKP